MYSKPTLLGLGLALGLAASAAAVAPLGPGAPHAVHRALQARQTAAAAAAAAATGTSSSSDDDTSCLTALISVYSTVPTPPPELLSYESEHLPTDACSYSVPASLAAGFSSYQSTVVDWFSSHSADVFSALSQCPNYSSYAGDTTVCTKPAPGGGEGDKSKNASPRETGYVAAVVAAAGFVGAVAAL